MEAHWYADWGLWQGLAAFLALFVSLAPTVRRLYKGAKLEVEVHDRIHLAHTAGNPNVSFYIMIRNTGGVSIRIKAIDLTFRPKNAPPFKVSGKGYFPQLTDDKQVLLTPFKLQPGEDWEHTVYFFNVFTRPEEQQWRQFTGKLRENLAEKAGYSEQPEADLEVVAPLKLFFQGRFRWHDDEYELDVNVHTEGRLNTITRTVRLTVFESESQELRGYVDQYATGLGILHFDHQKQPGVFVPVTMD